jgi:hypothetical protein
MVSWCSTGRTSSHFEPDVGINNRGRFDVVSLHSLIEISFIDLTRICPFAFMNLDAIPTGR